MKFSTREDIELSGPDLFAAVSDFHRLERVLQHRGAMVRRVSDQGADAWRISFDWRGKQHDLDLALVSLTPPETIALNGKLDMFELDIVMRVVSLTPRRSRLIFDLDVRPRGMNARLLLQAARLNRAKIDRKFAQRINGFLERITSGQFA